MKELVIEDLLYFYILGLKQICDHNRNIVFDFNILSKIQIIDFIKKKKKWLYINSSLYLKR